jgi:hypothetical protein
LGFTVPVLISGGGEIVDGHSRVEAARSLGMTQVPCISVDHLTADQVRLLRIAVNRLQERGAWDIDQLKLEFESLIELDVPLDAIGFELPEIEVVLSADEPILDAAANASPEPERLAAPISRIGDRWRLGEHVVVGGKGAIRHREFVAATGEMSAQEFEAFLGKFLGAAMSHVVDGGIGLSFIDWRQVEVLLRAGRATGLTLQNVIVWDKGRGGMGGTYRNAHELIAMFKRGDAPHLNNIELGKHGRDRTNIWSYPGATTLGSSAREQLRSHPTPKSVELVVDALLDLTNRREIVLDPFLGSGTTLIAAEKSGRRCFGLELDPAYVDVIVRRWETFSGDSAVHADTGLSFSELARQRAVTEEEGRRNDTRSPRPDGQIAVDCTTDATTFMALREADNE